MEESDNTIALYIVPISLGSKSLLYDDSKSSSEISSFMLDKTDRARECIPSS